MQITPAACLFYKRPGTAENGKAGTMFVMIPASKHSCFGARYRRFDLNRYSTPTEIAKFTSVRVYFGP